MILDTPYTIELLLHFHCCPKPFPQANTQTFIMESRKLEEVKAIVWDDSIKSYRTTELGDAWVKLLCNTPMPRLAYLDQNGKEIK